MLQVNEKAFSVWPLSALFTQTHPALISFSYQLHCQRTCGCVRCVCVSILFLHTCRFIWPARVSGLQGQGLSLCVYVCVIRSDVCRELECKHQVKLCLLSFWVSLIDSPLELALIIYQVLYHEGRVGKGDRMYLDRAWSYLNKSLWFVTFSNILSPFGRHLSKAPYNSLTAYTLNKSDHK